MKPSNQNSFDFDRVTFDHSVAEKQKQTGMEQASRNRKELLEIARLYALQIAQRQGNVTSDDVFAAMLLGGLDPTELGPAAGCVFRDKQFEFSGEWKKSQRVSNHARHSRVWRLKQDVVIAPLKKDVARQEAVRGEIKCHS